MDLLLFFFFFLFVLPPFDLVAVAPPPPKPAKASEVLVFVVDGVKIDGVNEDTVEVCWITVLNAFPLYGPNDRNIIAKVEILILMVCYGIMLGYWNIVEGWKVVYHSNF